MIQAVIFDMDGLLIDSEPLWHLAEIQSFGEVGIHLSPEMCLETTGLRIDETIKHWQNKFPACSIDRGIIEQKIHVNVIKQIESNGVAKPGTNHILSFFHYMKIPCAIASSSHLKLIEVVIKRLEIQSYMQIVHSAEHETYGKPHPAVYISTARKLHIPPENCLAFEDSINGILSAKSAKMKCVAIPELNNHTDKRLGIADRVLSSLEDFNMTTWTELQNS
ncbi:MAG: hexitol phosphatase HxpB [Candidatus Roizmanbacteria bacterium]